MPFVGDEADVMTEESRVEGAAAEAAGEPPQVDLESIPPVLSIPVFRGLAIANVFAALSFGTSRFVFVWLIGELTEWNTATAVLGIVLGLPPLLLSAWAGSLADHMNPRHLGFGLLVAGGVLFAVPAVILELGWMTVPLALACAFVAEIAPSMALPLLQALVPAVVPAPRLMQAVAIQNLGMMVSIIGGAFIGGGVIKVFGISGGFWFLTVTSLLAAVVYWLTPIPSEPAVPDADRRGAIMQGIRYALGSEPLRSLLMMAFIIGMATSVSVLLLPELARDVLGQDSLGAGILTAAMSIGMMSTALLLASVWKPKRPGLLVVVVLGGALGGGLVAIGLSRTFALTMLIVFIWGACGGIVLTLLRTLTQQHTPPEMMGRVMGLASTAQNGAFPVSALLLVFLVSTTSISTAFVICGVIFGVLVWLSAIRPHVRKL
jgi:MFS family permease